MLVVNVVLLKGRSKEVEWGIVIGIMLSMCLLNIAEIGGSKEAESPHHARNSFK